MSDQKADHSLSGGAMGYLSLSDAELLAQCRIDRFRAGGPGGQKRNKTESAVRLRHQPSGLSAIGVESRSQHQNRARALRRLRKAIALSLRSAVDRAEYSPSRQLRDCLHKARRLRVGERDRRYPHVVAEVLDVLAGCGVKVSSAADLLGISTANLVAFLARDARLWDCVNRMRTEEGLGPLR